VSEASEEVVRAAGLRVGQGYDIHRLVPGRSLVLAGVTLPWDLGLAGHSDGDAICHAIADALLGAAGLGDIGQHFPSEDPHWKDASSIGLLAGLAALLDRSGFVIHNVDVTVVMEVPRLGPYREEMIAGLADAIGLAPGQVGLKAKSNDGLGSVGAGEAIAAIAVALVEKRS
jgi:2-C-methyl-D-erythritol 2,4-cyclodiphosphate synthase